MDDANQNAEAADADSAVSGTEDPVELVHLVVGAPRATITLDSPANRNALSRRLVRELSDRLRTADSAAEVRVIVLTHTGSTFCAGADMAEALEHGMDDGTRLVLDLFHLVATLGKPVVVVVRGHVRAGGIGLVGVADVVVSSADATYAFTESRLGLAPAVISLTTLTRMPERQAQMRYLSGQIFDGAEAAGCGLVTMAVEAEAVDGAVDLLVNELAAASPQGLAETKRLLNRDLVARIADDGPGLAALSARLFGSDEARQAMAAFRARRSGHPAGTGSSQR